MPRKRTAHQQLDEHGQRVADEEEQREVSADALLDFYNALGRAVRGRLDDAGDSVLRVNDALRDAFERFDLETLAGGAVLVRPVLNSAEAARIVVEGGSPWRPALDLNGEAERVAAPPLRPIEAESASSQERPDFERARWRCRRYVLLYLAFRVAFLGGRSRADLRRKPTVGTSPDDR